MTNRSWQPIVHGELADRARESINEIAEQVAGTGELSNDSEDPDPALPGGLAGIALFFAYLAQATGDEAHRQRANALLGRCIELVGEMALRPHLHGGFTGTAWVLHHVAELWGDEEDPVDEIDEAILSVVSSEGWSWPYDLIGGLVGYAIYALDRLPRPLPRQILEEIARHFDRLHGVAEPGISWFTSPELMAVQEAEQHPKGYYNVGVAHGVPGILGVLGPMIRAGIQPKILKPLLEGGMRWLFEQEIDSPTRAFGYAAGDGNPRSRVAWCYGDPGVAAALWIAADAVGNNDWRVVAADIARRSTRRVEDAGVADAGLCHGSTGLALIYQRFHQYTGNEIFADAARSWLEYTLDHRREEGIAGYPAWMPREEVETSGWKPVAGFLTGASGVGLALLAAISDVEPNWDRSLLVSMRG